METSKNSSGKKRRFSALDIFIILLAVLCAAGIFIRLYLGDVNIDAGETYDKGEYAVSFLAAEVSTVYSEHFTEGTVFYMDDGTVFGTVANGVAITPARLVVEDGSGGLVQIYAADNGDDSLVDIHGTFTCEGSYSPERGFSIGGKIYTAANKKMTLHSKDANVEILVTDVVKVR